MAWSVLAAGIGATATTLAGAGTAMATSNLNEKTREWNEKMMDRQNQWNIENWNRANEYNTAGNQVARLQEAGLNPLYYGVDGVAAQPMESAQPLGWNPQTPDYTKGVGQAAQIMSDAALKDKQIEALSAEIRNKDADTGLKTNQSETEIQKQKYLQKQMEVMDANIADLMASSKLKESEKAKIDKFQEYADDIYQAQIDKDNSVTHLNESQKKKIDELLPGEKEIQQLTKKDFIMKWRHWSAEISHMFAQDKVLAKEAKYYLLDKLTSGVWGSGLSINNAILWSFMSDDPDLTNDEEQMLKQVLGVHDDEPNSKSKFDKKPSIDLRGYQYYGPGSNSHRPVYQSGNWSTSVSNPETDPIRRGYDLYKTRN